MDNLDDLFLSIENHIGKGGKFTEIKEIIENYTGNDWISHINTNTSGLDRNRVYLSLNIEALILSWKPSYETLPHDHSANVCWIKILSGNLIETLYNNDMEKLNRKSNEEGQCSFMSNIIGYHSIKNESETTTFSIHFYSPPMHKTRYFKLK
jgi:cysteine dioxygenase